MAHINFLGSLKRELHHVKAMSGTGEEKYEPAMFIFKEELRGKSFIVPLSCLWKYLDPRDNQDMRRADAAEFNRMAERIYFKRKFSVDRSRTADDAAAIIMAEQMNESTGVMLCTAYGLVKCCQLLELTVGTQTLAQLLMFIQDGLDDLKNMPNAEAENAIEHGEVCISVNGEKSHRQILMTETEALTGGV
jgi:hypothetical protein